MGKKKGLVTALALVLVLSLAGLVYSLLLSERYKVNAPTVPVASVEAEESANVESAAIAPDFSMLNADGETIRLSDFAGKPVVLNFWATWCPPCREELPHFNEAYADYGDRVTFLMTDLTDGQEETIEGVQAFLSENGYTFPVCYDTQSEGAYAYNINAIPQTYFIGADGKIRSYQIGALSRAQLYSGLAQLTE